MCISAVIADTYVQTRCSLLAARIQKLPEKFSGKIDIAQEAVKIRRGNIAAAKFVRLAIKWLYSWLYSFIYIPDFIHK